MKINVVGASYQERSLPFDAQRTINLYPVVDETGEGKEPSALYGTPGLSLFATAGSGSIRGCFYSTKGRAFVVSGDTLYELDSAGVATSRGTLTSSTTACQLEENTAQLAICDGTDLYTLTYATNAFAKVTDVDFPTASSLTFLDSYFVVSKPSTGQFYISALNDGTSWAALDFATAESSPDNLICVKNAVGQLWLFGERTTEIWTNTGASSFPFERVQGAKMEVGCVAAQSVIAVDNSVIWLGRDNKGYGIVYRARGFNPERISTFAIEYKLQQQTDLSLVRAYTYQQDGHTFYVLTGQGLETTLVYDLTTGLWHERAYLNTSGEYEIQLQQCHMFAFNKHLVGDRLSGNVYEMSLSTYTDNGNEIKRGRIFTHIFNEGDPIRVSQLQVDFETGVGLVTGQGSDPQCWLQVSEDFTRTWSSEYFASMGKIGEYRKRAIWRRFGHAYQMTFAVYTSEPVKVAICGGYLK